MFIKKKTDFFEKITDKNKDLDINLNDIKIFLNINNFNFELKKESLNFLGVMDFKGNL